MLPKPLYESLPYFCLVFGGISISFPTDILQAVSGLLLYTTGAVVWVLRSQHRRTSIRRRTKPNHQKLFLPEPFYESLPFIVMLVGILSMSHSAEKMLETIGFVFFVGGLSVLCRRHFERKPQSKHKHHIKM